MVALELVGIYTQHTGYIQKVTNINLDKKVKTRVHINCFQNILQIQVTWELGQQFETTLYVFDV